MLLWKESESWGMNERRVVLTYKLGWIMLWNFPSFSFLEIANIKLLFEIGLWAELNSVKTTHFHNVLSSQKTLLVYPSKGIGYPQLTSFFLRFGRFLLLCGAGGDLTWRRYQASTPYSAQSSSGTWFTTFFFHHTTLSLGERKNSGSIAM